MPLRTRLRRPTIVLGSIVTLLGVALTATSFTWREHMTVQRANGKELSGLSARDYPGRPGAARQRQGAQAADAAHRARGQGRPPVTTKDGCISDFSNTDVINCTYGDQRPPAPSRWPAARTPSTGSPHWTCSAGCTISRWSPI